MLTLCCATSYLLPDERWPVMPENMRTGVKRKRASAPAKYHPVLCTKSVSRIHHNTMLCMAFCQDILAEECISVGQIHPDPHVFGGLNLNQILQQRNIVGQLGCRILKTQYTRHAGGSSIGQVDSSPRCMRSRLVSLIVLPPPL